jgi:pimeloyl-ACP methyl ester carboxylesterase
MRICSLRIQMMLQSQPRTFVPVIVPRVGGRTWRRRPVWASHRKFVRHFAWQLVRPWRVAGFVHRRRHLRARIARRIFRRRYGGIARRCRRDLGWLNRHRAITAPTLRCSSLATVEPVTPACGTPPQCCGHQGRAQTRRSNSGDNARGSPADHCRLRPRDCRLV